MKGKKGSRILLIEDNLSQAELIKREVEKAGFDSKGLVHAISGERGLEILQKEAFDMVLLDCSLPAMDGAELLKRMREIHLDIPVIVISGQGGEKVAAKAMRIGSRNYISESDLFSPRQAAAILGVTHQTIKNHIYRGKLKTYKTPGGHHRIRREDLINLGCLDDRPSREEMVDGYNELYHGYISTLRALTNALDSRDGIASGHSRRVADYTASIAEVMGISEEEQEGIKLAALLHDIGKIFTMEQILSKPGRLTEQDRHAIRRHPEMGEIVVNGVEFLKRTKPFIRHHHERFDGKGYPDGLSGEEIPLGARMISLAEAYDCMVSECTFQAKRGLGEATDEMERHAGTQFDPEIVRVFLEEAVSKLRQGDIE
jgi:excisionase family DNA binding protein/putative nucleotidyltransferase with HDIG domain